MLITPALGCFTVILVRKTKPYWLLGISFFELLLFYFDFHSDIGMGIIIKVGDVSDLPRAPSNWQKCGNYIVQNESQDEKPDILKQIFMLLHKIIKAIIN